MDVMSGFSQLPGKSPLHKMQGLLLEDDAGLLEHTVFRVGSDPGRDLPSAGHRGLRDKSALPNLVSGQLTSLVDIVGHRVPPTSAL